MRGVHLGRDLCRQRLAIDLHAVAVRHGAAGVDGHLGQGIARLVALLRQSRDDADRGVVLVQRRAEFLPRLSQLLAQRVRLQRQRVPLVLEHRQQRRDRRQRRRPRPDDARRPQVDQVLDRQLLARDGVLAILGDVCLDEPFLEHVACAAVSFPLLGVARSGIPLLREATGACGASPETARVSGGAPTGLGDGSETYLRTALRWQRALWGCSRVVAAAEPQSFSGAAGALARRRLAMASAGPGIVKQITPHF